MKRALLFFAVLLFVSTGAAQPVWDVRLESKIRFYQTTDFGIVLAGTDDALYAIAADTGDRIWKRRHKGLDETSIAPVPATDIVLVSSDEGDRTRVFAVDLLSGETLWRSDRFKGDVMQLAVEPEQDLLTVVMVRRSRGRVGEEVKRSPVIHLLRLSDGSENWKKTLDSDVEMMPSRFDSEGEVSYTLDNYRPPVILDGRVFVFYEGLTAFDVKSGKEAFRDRFRVNEKGLALTEADVSVSERYIFASGRGKIRALDRRDLRIAWEADDLGVAAETVAIGDTLFVRTGGQFTRLRDGETDEKGNFGISALDLKTGRTKWRWKGADRGLTNFVLADDGTIYVADRDEIIGIESSKGRKLFEAEHGVERAQFIAINEAGNLVVGGRDTISAFPVSGGATRGERLKPLWSVKHKAPGRGLLRIVAGIALRAAAIYFRYGGTAVSLAGAINRISAARSLLSLRWPGLASRFGSLDLTTLATNAARNYVGNQISVFGIAGRNPNILGRIQGLRIQRPNFAGRIAPSREDLQENILDRIDPVRQMERLSGYLLKRKRVAELRGGFMYYYTEIGKPFDRKGLVGVDVGTGRDSRFILVSDPDPRFIADETSGLLFSADGSTLRAFEILRR